MNKKIILILVLIVTVVLIYKFRFTSFSLGCSVGEPIDSLNGVIVYYNRGMNNVNGRNTKDGYNLGLKYQCVEFVKRYYYEHYNHKMPETYGHAKSFFDKTVKDSKLNKQRNLTQFTKPSNSKPKIGDLVILDGTLGNKYGHVVIISNVKDDEIEIIQQNAGSCNSSRANYGLSQTENNKWEIENKRVLGWLRK